MRDIIVIFTILLGSHLDARETLMVCDAGNDSKRYYKLIDPWFGENEIRQKIDGQWSDWCRQPNCTKLEVYESGATIVHGSNWQTEANKDHYREIQVWLDFEFLTRRVEYRLYDDDTKTKQLWYKKDGNKTYNCELRG